MRGMLIWETALSPVLRRTPLALRSLLHSKVLRFNAFT